MNSVKQSLKRAQMNMWSIRNTVDTTETDSFPIELRATHRPKWTKVGNQVYTGNDGISYYDERHIDAGWNYVSVMKEMAVLPLEKPVLRRHVHSFENEHYRALDEMLEKQSAKEEEEDDLAKDWKTFGMCVSWHLEKIDEILERRSAKEEELDDDVKNRQTFENPIPWEYYPFEFIL
jgi:hypothetical protein